MALKIDQQRDQRSTRSLFVSKRRLYVTADDEVVDEADPRRSRLLVAAGGSIPNSVAASYGLVEVTPEVNAPTTDDAARTTLDAEADARADRPAEAPQRGELVADQKGDFVRYDDKSLKPEPTPTQPPAPETVDDTESTDDEATTEGLSRLKREELEAIAIERGIEAPDQLPNKAAVIAAIEAAGDTEHTDEATTEGDPPEPSAE